MKDRELERVKNLLDIALADKRELAQIIKVQDAELDRLTTAIDDMSIKLEAVTAERNELRSRVYNFENDTEDC